MKEKYFINARIIDPSQGIDEIGGLIVDANGKIKAVGKKVNKENIPKTSEKIDLKSKVLIRGIVDMKVFVGEPGFEYKENFRSLSNAALSGGVTSVVSMPNTSPAIDNVSMVDFILRRGRDKAGINIYPSATLTRNMDGKLMTEFGLLSKKGKRHSNEKAIALLSALFNCFGIEFPRIVPKIVPIFFQKIIVPRIVPKRYFEDY